MVTVKQTFPLLPDGNINLSAWLKHFERYDQLPDLTLIKRAAEFTRTLSLGLTTFYGQPFVEQGLEMADILLDMHLDADSAAAAMVVGIARQTHLDPEILKKNLGIAVTELVQNVLQMDMLDTLQARGQIQLDRLRKTFLAMTSDIRAILIRLAERTCIMRGIKPINPTERARIAQETLNIYAPLANRLGIGQLKWELEDNAFHFIHPDIYKTIATFLAEKRIDREKRIQENIALIQAQLNQVHLSAWIHGRAKHIHSIYLKAQRKQVDYQHIYDCSALRILVDNIEACYETLSIVHHLFQQIPEEFDDYISHPKPNGYRSIHTAVIDQTGKTLEIQIRTKQMHEEAEHGLAAHWVYKESGGVQANVDARVTLLRQLLAWQTDLTQQTPKITQLFHDTIYVLTPAGDIIDLPNGATPLDFAYHIHTQIGHRCRGAKIRGAIVPLTRTLQTGDIIEIMTAPPGAPPSRDWLNQHTGYLKTSRARAKVAHWFRQQDTQIIIEKSSTEKEHPKITEAAPVIVPAKHTVTTAPKSFTVAGIEDVLTRIAKCCKPIPGDKIIGYITQGRGISIHRENCHSIHQTIPLQNERLIPVSWDHASQYHYQTDIEIFAGGRANLLREISALLANYKIDLIALRSMVGHKNNINHVILSIKIENTQQLQQIIHQLQVIPGIIQIKRIQG